MHYLIKLLPVIAFIIIASGCEQNVNNIQLENISHETDGVSVNAEKLKIGTDSGEFSELNEVFSEETDTWIEDFEKRAAETESRSETPPCIQIRQLVKRNDSQLISVVTEKYVYLNGMHGNTWWSAKNYDISKGQLLTLADLFNDDTYPSILEERMNELIKNDPDTYHDLWEIPKIDKGREDKFYLDGQRLVIFYQPYELSYYARGVVEFPIELEKIRGYLKEEYLPAIK